MLNNAFRKEPDAEKPHVRNSVRDAFGNGCIYSTKMMDEVHSKYGSIDILVNNAGITVRESVMEIMQSLKADGCEKMTAVQS